MCTFSMIAQDWYDRHPWRTPPIVPMQPSNPFGPQIPSIPPGGIAPPENKQPIDWSQIFAAPEISRAEFDALKAELESLKKLLKAAKIYDEETGQKDCEDPEKVAMFRKLAELVGVSMEDIFPAAAK